MTALEDFVQNIRKSGFANKAILSDEDMKRLINILNDRSDVADTPNDELRYLEGMFHIPFGHIEYFRVIPDERTRVCACGRRPTALDIVNTAYVKRIHERDTIRDSLLGFHNIFELSEEGRRGDCFRCGRVVFLGGYFKQGYAYAAF
jgi:hypothetical protein